MNETPDMKNQTEDFWKKKLSPEEYRVIFEKGTERPFSGKFYNNFADGTYHCVACGQELFSSDTKFDSDCGWPSFDKEIKGNIEFREDNSYGMHRVEVVCSRCGGHLGHVFDDSSTKTGKWFCVNSLALNFTPKK